MIILDTNVLSALMTTVPDGRIVAWLDQQAPESVWTTAVTVFEVRLGLELLVPGRRKVRFEQAFSNALVEDLDGRVLPFDEAAAEAAAVIAARRQRRGVPIDLRDTQIAGIATVRRGAIATRNVRHFSGLDVEVVNPWRTH
ncbi:MAG: type II toxin-antitoxin system VapC family toxin [Myxococcaceae bacterium]|nr:type II toxin-antitoxin system VapC family toxin [Myxococcaceae bacterium]